LRTTDGFGNWHYRWFGLPDDCEIAVQEHIIGGENKPIDKKTGRVGNEWSGGRLRAVTFGYEGWVVYRGEHYQWKGNFPPQLEGALQLGRVEHWSINVRLSGPRTF
jgi:hypothetical protein